MKKCFFIISLILLVTAGGNSASSQIPTRNSTVVNHQAAAPNPSSGTSSLLSASGIISPLQSKVSYQKGIVQGKVVLGPTCPVERIPPDPRCAPKPYQTKIRIQSLKSSIPSIDISTNALGVFKVSLDPGRYSFHALSQNNSNYPLCRDVQIQVRAGKSQTITINCDTGIR